MEQMRYKTKVVVEIDLVHWSTVEPKLAVDSIVLAQLHCPAVEGYRVLEIKSNYNDYGRKPPLDEMIKIT